MIILNILTFFILFLFSILIIFLIYKNNKTLLQLVIFLFSLSSSMMLLGFLGKIYPLAVILISVLFYFICYFFLKDIQIEIDFDKKTLVAIFLLMLTFLILQLNHKYAGGQDALTDYLPMSRYLAQQKVYPSSWVNLTKPDVRVYKIGYPPLLINLGAFLFQATGLFSERVAAVIPAIFFILFLIILFELSKTNVSNIFLVCLLLFISLPIIEQLSWFYGEGPLVFSATLVLFSLYKFIEHKETKYYRLALLASGICFQTKYLGILFVLIVIAFGIYYGLFFDKKNLTLFAITHAVGLFWYFRNLILFGMLFPPIPIGITLFPSIKKDLLDCLLFANAMGNKWFSIASSFLLGPIFLIWFALVPFWGIKKLNFFDRFVYLFSLFTTAVLNIWIFLSVRFLMIFLAPALIQTEKIISNFFVAIDRKRTAKVIICFLVFLIISAHLSIIYIQTKKYDVSEAHIKAVNFLKENHKVEKEVRVFVDSDFGFRWFGGFCVYDPSEPFFSLDFNEAVNQKNPASLFKKYRLAYAINDLWVYPWEKDFFGLIDNDKKNFKKIYSDEKARIEIWEFL